MQLLLLLVHLFNFLTGSAQAADPYWSKLLHYHKNISRADSAHFFLSPKGKTDPDAEMEADIKAFKDPNAKAGWFGYHPQCVFRERFEYLLSVGKISINELEEKPCSEFLEWEKGLNVESISVIFSSSYPNNPSSLFGHTLLRLNQYDKKNDLLDYAVAFSAVPESEDIGVVFAAKGMFGGYKGLLEVTKYYTKVMEYNNGESRDLIEYDLIMTAAEKRRLINHLWEIYQTTYFDYFFLDENCSAVLSDILAVAFNDERINDHERWYYLPSEMVKTFKKFGKVQNGRFRPSLKKQLEKRLEHLNASQKSEVKALAESKDLPSDYNNIPVLDGVIALLDFTRYRTKNELTQNQKVMMRKTLLRRSALNQETNTTVDVYNESNRPDQGHEPQKFSIFTRVENSHSLLGIEVKEGYHDLLSKDDGYDPFSQFDFFTGSIVFDKSLNKLSYDKLTFVDLISLHSYKFYDPQFSWAAKVLSDRLYDFPCDLCHKLNARAYLGPTVRPNDKIVMSVMTGGFAELGKNLPKGHRAGVGFEGSFLYQLGTHFKVGLFDEIRFDVTKKWKDDHYNTLSLKTSYFPMLNTEWRLESSLIEKTKLFQLNYGFYF